MQHVVFVERCIVCLVCLFAVVIRAATLDTLGTSHEAQCFSLTNSNTQLYAAEDKTSETVTQLSWSGVPVHHYKCRTK